MAKPYANYKDSDVPWLGQIPNNWDLQRGKFIFKTLKELNRNKVNSNVLSLTLRGVVNNDPDNPEGLVPKDYATYQIFRKGDLVFKLIDLENLRTSRVGLVHEDGIMSSAYVRLIPQKNINVRFFYYYFYDLYLRGIYNQIGAGVRATLGPKDLLNLKVVIASQDEQERIVKYLDFQEQRFRQFIRTKQRAIKLLNEQRNAIIKNAVMKGITSDCSFKSSNTDWMGEIPVHWDILKGFQLIYEKQEKNIGLKEKRVLSLSYGQIIIKPVEKLHGLVPASFDTYQIVDPGDIIIRSTDLQNDKVSLRVGLVKDRGIITSAYLCFRTIDRILPDYAYYLLHTYDVSKVFYGLGSGLRQNLGFIDFKRLPVLLPPKSEQSKIVDYISVKTARLKDAIDCFIREIDLLKEYRKRMIADVITGKIDIREAKVADIEEENLQELIDEQEISDDIEDSEEVVNADE